jgi:nucleoside-diphosphate-sugar epimerase
MPNIINNELPPGGYQPGVSIGDLQLIIEKTPANVWDTLRGSRIFITGGTGFIGCWLLEALIWSNEQLDLGISVSVLSRNPESFKAKAPHLATHKIVHLVQGNTNNLELITGEYDVVIHAATDVANANSNALITFDEIVNGTKQTLELARRSNAKCYLLTSSGAVYGNQPFDLTHVPETLNIAPDTMAVGSAYGQGKRVSEWLCRHYSSQYGIDVKIARCFALLGPYLPLDAHFAAGNFIRNGLRNEPIYVNGNGSPHRSFLYAADMVIWLLAILVNGQSSQPYNVGSDSDITIKDLAETVSEIMYGESKVMVASPLSTALPQRYVPDVNKVKNELGLQIYTDLKSSLNKTISWENQKLHANKPD